MRLFGNNISMRKWFYLRTIMQSIEAHPKGISCGQ